MHDTVIRSNLTTTRRIQIGRLNHRQYRRRAALCMELGARRRPCATHSTFGHSRLRLRHLHPERPDPSDQHRGIHPAQSAWSMSFHRRRVRSYDGAYPRTELRGRLVSIEDHVGGRFGANERMTCLLVDLVKGIAELFADRAPPNPQALATEIVSFVALTIGTEDRGAATDVRKHPLPAAPPDLRFHRKASRRSEPLAEEDCRKQPYLDELSLQPVQRRRNHRRTVRAGQAAAKGLRDSCGDPKGHRTVAEVAYEVGFKNVSHFSRSFSRHFSVAPRDVRQLGQASVVGAGPAAEPGKNAIVRGKVAALASLRRRLLGKRQAACAARGRHNAPALTARPCRPPATRSADFRRFPWLTCRRKRPRSTLNSRPSSTISPTRRGQSPSIISARRSISNASRIRHRSTIADQAIERELRRRISIRFPDHGILGEEWARRRGTVIPGISIRSTERRASFRHAAVRTLIALSDERERSIVAGMIDMPALAERWYGRPGRTTFNGKRVSVAQTADLADAQIYTSSPDFFTPRTGGATTRSAARRCFRRFGGDCYQYGLLASGLLRSGGGSVTEVLRLHGAGAGRRRRRRVMRDWEGRPPPIRCRTAA